MSDRGAHLRFDIVTDERQTAVFKASLPITLRGNENRDAIDQRAARLKNLLDIPFGGHFGADGQIRYDYIRAGRLQDSHDVVGGTRRLLDRLLKILAQP